MTTIFKLVKSCDILGLKENFQGISKLKKNPTKEYSTSFFCLYKFANKGTILRSYTIQ